MHTTRPHAPVERQRFARHALASLTGWFTPSRRERETADDRQIEAGKVRELAYSYSKTDPGFAADLYAAAARHEGLPSDWIMPPR